MKIHYTLRVTYVDKRDATLTSMNLIETGRTDHTDPLFSSEKEEEILNIAVEDLNNRNKSNPDFVEATQNDVEVQSFAINKK